MNKAAALLLLGLACGACGRKGPPLPPLVLIPNAPGDASAARRAEEVSIQFTIPSANVDGSTPADLRHIDVFALTAPAPVASEDVLQQGTRVARVEVNPPPDPDDVGDEQAIAGEQKPPKDRDQGAVTRVSETLTDLATTDDARLYVAVGVSNRGRRGRLSPLLSVPMGPPPPPPAAPQVTYDEKAVTVSWPPAGGDASTTYHVYQLGEPETRLTSTPTAEVSFVRPGVTWDAEQCFALRAVDVRRTIALESAASPPACVTPKDTFAPGSPAGLQTIASVAAVNLIWEANVEPDLAGYVVLRAIEPETNLSAVTPNPLPTPTFTDAVPSGSRVTYAVQAVDRAGNVSAASARVVETAR